MKRLSECSFAVLLLCFLAGCDDLSKYPIDEKPIVKTDTRLVGKWAEKKEKGRNSIYTMAKKDETSYNILIKDSKSKISEQYDAFLSDVNAATFLNVACKNDRDSLQGYSLIRILNINAAGNMLTAASVADSTMKDITSSAAVRERIRAHLNDPKFYRDTVLFYKVK
jgi:hypothetical protein